MIFSPSWSAVLLLFAGLGVLTAHAAVDKVNAVGSKFFYENGTQYYMKGIAYQLVPEDPLIDTDQCQRDISRMAELGVNAIRVYHVDPYADHTGCMDAFAGAGIYLFVDLDTFDTQIEQTHPEWTERQFSRFKTVLDEFQRFDNTAGVFVGNEVITTEAGSAAAPFVLAAARDVKAYRDHKGYRPVPVGYSAADIAELRPMLQDYLACGKESADRLDFFGLNAYEWCGSSGYIQSGYSKLQKNASHYPIPIFFSETGCNTVRPRTFEDQVAIFRGEMADTWSGSIVYEWIEETNDYGLISYGPSTSGAAPTNTLIQDGFTRKGTPTPVSPDFENLKRQWATLNPMGVALSEYAKSTSTITPPACPASTSGGWAVDPSSPLPTLGQQYTGGGRHSATSTSQTGTSDNSAASGTRAASASTTTAPVAAATTTKESGSSRLAGIPLMLCILVGVVVFWL